MEGHPRVGLAGAGTDHPVVAPWRVKSVLELVTAGVSALTLLERELTALVIQTRALWKTILKRP